MTKAVGERNEVECSFGTGKRIYRTNNIRVKLPETAECWTGMCYFVKNVMKFHRELLFEFWLNLWTDAIEGIETAVLHLWLFINIVDTN